MSLEGWDALKWEKAFHKGRLKATKKAGRKVGMKIRKEARRALGKVSPERRKLLNYKVRKNGTLANIDEGANARIREYGKLIVPKKTRYLRVYFDNQDRGEPGDFVRKVGGKTLVFQEDPTRPGETRPIAVLLRKVEIKAEPKSKRLSEIAERHFDEYINEIEEQWDD